MTDFPRILIVGTTPYSPDESSRALDTYFHNWPKEKLNMIFSNSNKPMKGHCGSLYQITDYDLFHSFGKRNKKVGRVFNYNDLPDRAEATSSSNKLTKFKKKNAFRYYARKTLWKKRRWLTERLIQWVDDFNPQAIYICFSDDYFILDVAYYFARKYNIPVICQIGDDYYFKKNKNLFFIPYLRKYKALFKRIMSLDGFGVYISDKLADKYNSVFKLKGHPFYLSSQISSENKGIRYEFNYFGKTEPGRHHSLAILGDALNLIDPNFKINVYCKGLNNKTVRFLTKHHCEYKNSVSYNEVASIMNSGSFNIIASGFSKKDVEITRYSLSTKVSDSLASSGPIIAVGPEGDGAIDFLNSKECSIMVIDKNVNIDELRKKLLDQDYLSKIIRNAHKISSSLFETEINRAKFEECCRQVVGARE